ncbi:MAG: thioredoxin family protein [Gemmataceae bacterium]|nr:thioredoxin family protein [Gemmataceae bacterium]
MFRTVPVLALLLAVAPAARADDPPEKKGPPAKQLVADAQAKAKQEGKAVFLVFGSPGCVWCKHFDKFHADPEAAKVVGKYFVLVKVDVALTPGGEDLYQKYGGDRGVPAWTILDPAGKELADSGDGDQNVGFPYEPHEVDHYVKAVRKAVPKITDAETELLVKKLKEAGPKKE